MIPLRHIRPGGRPKGFAPYEPSDPWRQLTVARILETYQRIADAQALPLGPRQVGYRLSMQWPGDYDKDDFKRIEELVKRLGQASAIPFSWIADAGSVTHLAPGVADVETYAEAVPDGFVLDRRVGQPLVIEIYAETRETLPLIRRVAHERGVTVYSGGGSKGPNLAVRVADRAVRRAVEHGQSTLILGICDFDIPGIRNILRPHIEHLAAFLYGEKQLAAPYGDGDSRAIEETEATVEFEHLALTPEQALEFVEGKFSRQPILKYLASGDDLWTRDLKLLDGAPKVETEALDPVVLRTTVIDAIESRLDLAVLRAAEKTQAAGRRSLRSRLKL
jgi:hypothetical protein